MAFQCEQGTSSGFNIATPFWKRRRMRVALRVNAGRNAGQEIPIRIDRFLIGRADDCHLRANSSAVSRYHCAIFVEDSGVWVRDYGSRNGTLVDGVRIAERRRLQDGNQLQVGPLQFVIQIDNKPSAVGETSLAGKLETTLQALARRETTTREGEILQILSQPPQLPTEPLTVAATNDDLAQPADLPTEEPLTLPKPKPVPVRRPEPPNPADAAVDGLKRLFRPKKQ
jgi:predicted component of type VI protein secretion system